MSRPAFFIVLIALIIGIFYVMYGSDNPPETSFNQTPKEYIQQIEQKKAVRMAVEKALKQSEERTRQALGESESQR
ncbi:MAG: aldehyde dehydrogenase [Candidatus Thiodiazotropha sp.]|jgi:Tfp pilus assembly protein PilO